MHACMHACIYAYVHSFLIHVIYILLSIATQQGDEEETMATKLSTGSLQIRYSRIAKRRQATLAELILNDDDVVYPRDDRATFFEQVCVVSCSGQL